jgi:hypothetical protein
MIEHWHGDIKVNWSDDEWDRLQKIKRGEYVRSVGVKQTMIAAHVSTELKARIDEYAKARNIGVSELVRNVLYVLTQ